MSFRLVSLLCCLLAGCAGDGGPVILRELKPWEARATPAGEVNLLVLGDWGQGTDAQKRVADAMGAYHVNSAKQFDAVVTVGDNFYDAVRTVKDKRWFTLFEDVYDVDRLNMPFYAALGNHDYGGQSVEAELAYQKAQPKTRWRMPGRWYRVDFPAGRPIVSVLVLDSNESEMSRAMWAEQLAWMDRELAAASREAQWVVTVGHHPPFSNGWHGDNPHVEEEWGPLWKRHRVDFHLAGHDHDMQHIQVGGYPATDFVISGGGGAAKRWISGRRGPFARLMNGFVHLHFTEAKAVLRILDDRGRVAYEYAKERNAK
jgi:tartrate-resistant acid phosphatase type 5